jgi:hypothetical protein
VFDRAEEYQAVAKLCGELASLGLNIGLSDARPAVVIWVKGTSSVYVTLDVSGEFFEWGKPQARHPIGDPAGAASQLAKHVKARQDAGREEA